MKGMDTMNLMGWAGGEFVQGSLAGIRWYLEPLPLDAYWILLLVPLVAVVSIVYKTLKVSSLDKLPVQASLLAAQILGFMVLAAAVLWLVSEIF